jgi:hypothetical protein
MSEVAAVVAASWDCRAVQTDLSYLSGGSGEYIWPSSTDAELFDSIKFLTRDLKDLLGAIAPKLNHQRVFSAAGQLLPMRDRAFRTFIAEFRSQLQSTTDESLQTRLIEQAATLLDPANNPHHISGCRDLRMGVPFSMAIGSGSIELPSGKRECPLVVARDRFLYLIDDAEILRLSVSDIAVLRTKPKISFQRGNDRLVLQVRGMRKGGRKSEVDWRRHPSKLLNAYDLSFIDIIMSIPKLTQREAFDVCRLLLKTQFLFPWLRAKVTEMLYKTNMNIAPDWPESLGRMTERLNQDLFRELRESVVSRQNISAVLAGLERATPLSLFLLSQVFEIMGNLGFQKNEVVDFLWDLLFRPAFLNDYISRDVEKQRLMQRIAVALKKKPDDSRTRSDASNFIDWVEDQEYDLPESDDIQIDDFLGNFVENYQLEINSIIHYMPGLPTQSGSLYYLILLELSSVLQVEKQLPDGSSSSRTADASTSTRSSPTAAADSDSSGRAGPAGCGRPAQDAGSRRRPPATKMPNHPADADYSDRGGTSQPATAQSICGRDDPPASSRRCARSTDVDGESLGHSRSSAHSGRQPVDSSPDEGRAGSRRAAPSGASVRTGRRRASVSRHRAPSGYSRQELPTESAAPEEEDEEDTDDVSGRVESSRRSESNRSSAPGRAPSSRAEEEGDSRGAGATMFGFTPSSPGRVVRPRLSQLRRSKEQKEFAVAPRDQGAARMPQELLSPNSLGERYAVPQRRLWTLELAARREPLDSNSEQWQSKRFWGRERIE